MTTAIESDAIAPCVEALREVAPPAVPAAPAATAATTVVDAALVSGSALGGRRVRV